MSHPHRVLSYALIAVLAALTFPSGALAQEGPTPEDIAQNCILNVTVVAQRRINRNEAIASSCVVQIEELLEAGHPGLATHLGRHCIKQIQKTSANTARSIQHRCFHCRLVLVALGAPGLGQQVAETCDDRVGAVRTSKAVSVLMIRNALP